ncbi:MAG: Ig-like domain-containing protein [Bacteroidota bacterium]
MNFKAIISFIAVVTAVSIAVLSGSGCANIIPPQGGYKDSLPPILIKANPGDSARNFKGNRINFSFDEFIDLENVQSNLIVSPTPKTDPGVDYKLNSVSVKLKDTLEPNTTYSLNFGNAIKDVNEGNVLKNFTYIFSTGPYIDSMQLQGQVFVAETGKIDSTLIVMLHTSSDDSVIIKEKPRYVAKLDSMGRYTFKNLPPATFYLYALKDNGGTRRYFDDKQLFAFADRPIVVNLNTDPVNLYAFAGNQEKAEKTSSPLTGTNIGGNRNRPSATVEKRLKYQTNLRNTQQDLVSDFIMTFEEPLKFFDSTGINLYADSAFSPVTSYQLIKDSSNETLKIVNTWSENRQYHIILNKDFAEDSSGNKLLKSDTINFSTNKISDYGSLKIKFLHLDLSKNPVFQIIAGAKIHKSYPLVSENLTEALFIPGEYELRMLFDDNKNGKWDPGEFFEKHRQPEIVKPFSRDKITIKKSWENEFDLECPSY